MKPLDHITIIKEQLEAIETEGHLEKNPPAWLYHSQLVSAVYGLELALRQDLKKGEHDDG